MLGRRTRSAASRPRRLGLLAVPSIAALLLCAGAVAYWSAPGAGSATGTLADQQPLALSAGTPTALLYPGASADVAVTITNPNTSAVHLSALALDTSQGSGGFAVDAAHSGCELAALNFTTQSNSSAGWTVPARVGSSEGSLSLDLAGALSMSAAAANACQGASFTIFLKASS
jgi:hypothetical protein